MKMNIYLCGLKQNYETILGNQIILTDAAKCIELFHANGGITEDGAPFTTKLLPVVENIKWIPKLQKDI